MKVGDKVWLCKGIKDVIRKKVTIIRETKTQWVVDGTSYNHFWKKNNVCVSSCSYIYTTIEEIEEGAEQ